MRYFRRGETKNLHVCKTVYSCQRCYSSNDGCDKEPDFIQECTECHVIFNNRLCFTNHLTKKIFKNTQGKFETPCAHMFFCKTCYKTVARMTVVASKKTTRHKCDEMFCTHCNAIKKLGIQG